MRDGVGPGVASRPAASRGARVTSALRADIVAGVYPPGERLTEERLALAYGVSRVPVREAIRTLESEGFLRLVPYWGTVVAQLTSREVADLLEVRGALEVLAAHGAATHRSQADLIALAEVLADGEAAVQEGDLALLAELNTRFHLLLARASGNATLLDTLTTLSAKIQWVYASNISARARSSWQEHKAVLAAVRRGDPVAARSAVERHIGNARRAFRELSGS